MAAVHAASPFSTVKRVFPPERQATMYAFLSVGWVLPSLLAPALAGIVTDHIGWLAASKIALGWPPYAASLAAIGWVLARGHTPIEPAAAAEHRHPAGPAPGPATGPAAELD